MSNNKELLYELGSDTDDDIVGHNPLYNPALTYQLQECFLDSSLNVGPVSGAATVVPETVTSAILSEGVSAAGNGHSPGSLN